jgi:hypothetical protein
MNDEIVEERYSSRIGKMSTVVGTQTIHAYPISNYHS